jgi:hypothetical protein
LRKVPYEDDASSVRAGCDQLYKRLCARRAFVVLSGLLPAQANDVLAIARAQGLRLERRIRLEGWVTLVLKNSSGGGSCACRQTE